MNKSNNRRIKRQTSIKGLTTKIEKESVKKNVSTDTDDMEFEKWADAVAQELVENLNHKTSEKKEM